MPTFLSPSRLLVATGTLVLALAADHSRGHAHPCSHFHQNSSIVTCNSQGAACTTPAGAGTCQSIQGRTAIWCQCVVVPPPPAPGPCLGFANLTFSVQGDGLPAADSERIYLAIPSVENSIDAVIGPFAVDVASDAVEGTVTLDFDATLTSALVSDISVALPAIGPNGSAFLHLGAKDVVLSYDAELSLLSSPQEGIVVETDVNGMTLPLTAYLTAQLEANGDANVQIQLSGPGPTFWDGFESGNTDRWSSTVARLLDAFGLFEQVAGHVGDQSGGHFDQVSAVVSAPACGK